MLLLLKLPVLLEAKVKHASVTFSIEIFEYFQYLVAILHSLESVAWVKNKINNYFI